MYTRGVCLFAYPHQGVKALINPINTAFLENAKWLVDFYDWLNNEKTIVVCTQIEWLQGLTDYSIMAY